MKAKKRLVKALERMVALMEAAYVDDKARREQCARERAEEKAEEKAVQARKVAANDEDQQRYRELAIKKRLVDQLLKDMRRILGKNLHSGSSAESVLESFQASCDEMLER